MPIVTAPTRIALQNILVAADFSAGAQAALSCALGLTHRYDSTLFTIHVLPQMPFVESPEPDPEQIRHDAQQKLASMAASTGFQGIHHIEMIQEGEVTEVVSNLARTKAIDLIVLGTAGRTGMGKFLLGSVAEEVFRTASCPVMTVGPHVTRGASGGRLQHILYATDFGPESAHAFAYALSLAEEHKARLTMMHVAPEPGVVLPDPAPGAMPVADPYEAVKDGETQLRELVPADTALWQEPEYLVQFGTPVETILRVAATDVDLIVLGVKRPAAFTKHLGSGVAYRVVCEAPCPVLTVGA